MLRETLRAEVNKAMHGKNFSKDKEGEKEKKKAIKETCAKFVAATGIKKVKVKERLNVIRILDRNGKAYKAYKGDSNDYMEVWRLPNGEWEGQIVPTFDANRPNSGGRLRPHPAAKKLMTLYNDDMVRLVDESGEERTLRIVKMSKQTVVMADHMEAGNLKDRDAEKNDVDPFKYFSKNVASLRNLKFRKLRVSPSGIAHDPGPPAGNGK
jgi:CRISPR-associated endonuclease Csn1